MQYTCTYSSYITQEFFYLYRIQLCN